MLNEFLNGHGESTTVALVPLEPRRAAASAPRPLAAFVTQVIAARAGLPDARARRRAGPEAACSRYRAGTERAPAPRRLDRDL